MHVCWLFYLHSGDLKSHQKSKKTLYCIKWDLVPQKNVEDNVKIKWGGVMMKNKAHVCGFMCALFYYQLLFQNWINSAKSVQLHIVSSNYGTARKTAVMASHILKCPFPSSSGRPSDMIKNVSLKQRWKLEWWYVRKSVGDLLIFIFKPGQIAKTSSWGKWNTDLHNWHFKVMDLFKKEWRRT